MIQGIELIGPLWRVVSGVKSSFPQGNVKYSVHNRDDGSFIPCSSEEEADSLAEDLNLQLTS